MFRATVAAAALTAVVLWPAGPSTGVASAATDPGVVRVAPAPAQDAPQTAPVEAAPDVEAPPPESPPEDASPPEAFAGLGADGADMTTVLAETQAALDNPDLGDQARVIVQLFKLINETRAEHGLYPLRLDARLVGAAQDHAGHMTYQHFCSHWDRSGMSAKQRIEAHGYHHNNWAGEDILCSRRTPEDALAWWMNSGPHRRNILHQHFTHIGIGYDPAGEYGSTWVLTFAAGEPDTLAVGYLPSAGTTSP